MPLIRDTVSDILELLRVNLERGIDLLASTPTNADNHVVLSNIAFAENAAGHLPPMADQVVITLLKVEEEAAMKNQPAYRRNPVSGNLENANPPVFLNLYLLFTANYLNYTQALRQLSRVIGYFQYKRVFKEIDAEVVIPNGFPILHFDFNLSLLSPSFEQLNHIWGTLGGKMLPHAIYKMQLLQLEYIPDEAQPAPLIQTLELQEKIY